MGATKAEELVNVSLTDVIASMVDYCKRYDPDESRPSGLKREDGTPLYMCKRFHQIPDEEPGLGTGYCELCYNHQRPDGSFVNEPERQRDGVQ